METLIIILILIIGASCMVLPKKRRTKIIVIPVGVFIFMVGLILSVGVQYVPYILGMLRLNVFL